MLKRLIKTILNNQESCIISGGKTKYFKLERAAQQGHPFSAYLFILLLEIFFVFIKNNPNVKGLNIFKHEFLYTACANDTTFFLKNAKSLIDLMSVFTKTRERAKTTQNQPKQPLKKLQSNPKQPNIVKLWGSKFSTSFRFSNF